MRKEQRFLFKVIVFLVMAVAVLLDYSYLYVFANDINGNEQRVIEEISGIFEVNGETYRIESALITEVKNYLAGDGVDLTAEQAQTLIQYFYDNMQTAILESYLILVETQNEVSEEMNQNGEDPTQVDQGGEVSLEKSQDQGEEAPFNEEIVNQEEDNTNKNSNQDIEVENYIEDNLEENLIDEIKSQINHTEDDLSGDTTDNTINNANQNLDSTLNIEEIGGTEGSPDNEKTSETGSPTRGNKILFGGIVLLFFLIIVIVVCRYISSRNVKKNHANQGQDILGHYIDIHSHILPNIDDGSSNMEETIRMLKLAWEQGIHTIIATPHYHVGRRTTPERLAEIATKVQMEAKKIDKTFRILLGNEILYEEGCLEALKQNRACTMAESRYVLVEFTPDESFQQIYDGMRDFVMEGYSPIIAHVERYHCLLNKKERIRSLVQLGCYIQVNTESLKGRFLSSRANYIRGLIVENLVHFIATDSHNVDSRSPNMEDSIRVLKKSVDETIIVKLVVTNPSKILEKKFI